MKDILKGAALVVMAVVAVIYYYGLLSRIDLQQAEIAKLRQAVAETQKSWDSCQRNYFYCYEEAMLCSDTLLRLQEKHAEALDQNKMLRELAYSKINAKKRRNAD